MLNKIVVIEKWEKSKDNKIKVIFGESNGE